MLAHQRDQALLDLDLPTDPSWPKLPCHPTQELGIAQLSCPLQSCLPHPALPEHALLSKRPDSALPSADFSQLSAAQTYHRPTSHPRLPFPTIPRSIPTCTTNPLHHWRAAPVHVPSELDAPTRSLPRLPAAPWRCTASHAKAFFPDLVCLPPSLLAESYSAKTRPIERYRSHPLLPFQFYSCVPLHPFRGASGPDDCGPQAAVAFPSQSAEDTPGRDLLELPPKAASHEPVRSAAKTILPLRADPSLHCCLPHPLLGSPTHPFHRCPSAPATVLLD